MARQIGGFSMEARYFVVRVPEGWKETDPLPDPSPDDLWFDNVTEFKASLDGPWIRRPVRRKVWKKARRAVTTTSGSVVADGACSSSSGGDALESKGGHRDAKP